MKKVAIVGAGAAGLCAARHLKVFGINPIIFEQGKYVGGTWVYESIPKFSTKDVFSSMYENLRTNQPIEVMQFDGFPYPKDLPSYVHHSVIRKYLEDYARTFDLVKSIRFQATVTNLVPVANKRCDRGFAEWKLESIQDKNTRNEIYDAVVVASGHNSVPTYPTIDGMKHFKGQVLHCHYYRRPQDFHGCSVLILGSGPSGSDIMLELSKTCKHVFYSHRKTRCQSKLPENVVECYNIKSVTEDGRFVFEDDKTADVDVFMPCTGYEYSFPFLTAESGIFIKERVVSYLYKHIFNVQYPSMSFVGIPWTIATFPLFDQQCAYIAKIILGQRKLPPRVEMLLDVEKEYLEKLSSGEPSRYFHELLYRQFQYNDELSELSGYRKAPMVLENLYRYNFKQRETNLQGYKNVNYKVINDRDFMVLNPNEK